MTLRDLEMVFADLETFYQSQLQGHEKDLDTGLKVPARQQEMV
jgi:hypothetical protein